jgi:hypothetical protein
VLLEVKASASKGSLSSGIRQLRAAVATLALAQPLTGGLLVIVDLGAIVEGFGEGTDTVEFAGFSSYTLNSNLEILILGTGSIHGTGNLLNNTLIGNSDNNSLTGAAGRDSITAGDGNDTLIGASGSVRNEIDTLTGGNGSDLFVLGNSSVAFYNDATASLVGTTDYALITDFNTSQDSLILKRGTYYFGAGSAGYQDLFLELGRTDEMIARFQGVTSLSTTAFSSSTLPAGISVSFV